jgi:hypothetical protein
MDMLGAAGMPVNARAPVAAPEPTQLPPHVDALAGGFASAGGGGAKRQPCPYGHLSGSDFTSGIDAQRTLPPPSLKRRLAPAAADNAVFAAMRAC